MAGRSHVMPHLPSSVCSSLPLLRQSTRVCAFYLQPTVAEAMKGAAPIEFHHCKSEKELDGLIAGELKLHC